MMISVVSEILISYGFFIIIGFRRQGRLPLPDQGRERVEGSRQERSRVDAGRRVRPQLHHRRSADAEDRQERQDRLPRLLAPEG